MRILTFLLGWLWRKPDGYWICGACSHVSKGSELLWNVWPVRQFVCPVSCCSHGVTRVTVTDWEAQEVRLQEEAAEQERQLVHEEWRQREEAAEQERQRLHEEEERQRATRREERLRKMWADFGDLLRESAGSEPTGTLGRSILRWLGHIVDGGADFPDELETVLVRALCRQFDPIWPAVAIRLFQRKHNARIVLEYELGQTEEIGWRVVYCPCGREDCEQLLVWRPCLTKQVREMVVGHMILVQAARAARGSAPKSASAAPYDSGSGPT